MTLHQTLLEAATDLATDAAAKAAFAEDPEGFLAERGLDDWTAEDLYTAMEHVGDALPADLAAQLPEPSADADATEVFGALADVDPEVGEADGLEFGVGEAPEGDDAGDGDQPEETPDAVVEDDVEEGPDAEEWTDALDAGDDEPDDVDGEVDDLDLDFGAGADDAPDDVAE